MPNLFSSPGLQKAAILMVLLGEEAASHIYRHLPETDVQRLTRRIAELEHFKPETAISVLEEYHQLTLTQSYLAEGGPEYAQKLLVKAFGENGRQAAARSGPQRDRTKCRPSGKPAGSRPAAVGQVSRSRAPANHRPHPGPSARPSGLRALVATAGRSSRRNRQAPGAVASVFPRSRPESCAHA